MATLLNIAGLSVAFAAFIIIMMQLDYDWNFAKMHPGYDRIYRLEIINNEGVWAIQSRPLVDRFIQSSPHIEAGTLMALSHKSDMFFSVERNGGKVNYREKSSKVYPNFVDVFEFEMVEGDKNALSDPEKVLIPLSLSEKIFGNESAIDKRLITKETTYIVGGIYKDFPTNTVVDNSIYYPMADDEMLHAWDESIFYGYIRLDSPDKSEEALQNFKSNFDVSSAGGLSRWMGEFNMRLTPITELHYTTDTFFDLVPKTSRPTLLVLFTIAWMIILIAGINFNNFSMALSPMRIKSINTQKVLGANEGSLKMSLIIEAVVICFIAFLLSLGLVFLFSKSSYVNLISTDLILFSHPWLLMLTGLIALITGFLAGIYPSYYTTSFTPALVLKGSFGLSPKGRKLRNALISVQFFASFVLIICSIFMYLQNNHMQQSPVGYDKDNLIITDVSTSVMNDKKTVVNELKTFSEIQDVTFSDVLISSADQYIDFGRMLRNEMIHFQCIPVDVSFLDVMGIDIIEGRNFRMDDERLPYGAFIFNKKAQETYNIVPGDKIDGAEVIGIMPDIKFASFRSEVVPMAFYTWGVNSHRPNVLNSHAYIKLKANSDPGKVMKDIQSVMNSSDAHYTFNLRPFDDVFNKLYDNEQRLSSLIILFSLIAIFISTVGVFGLVVFDSEYRKREIGIRKVLGSTIREIIVLFNKTYVRILFICFLLAVPVAWYTISIWLENFAYKIPMFWWVYMIAFLLVFVITSGTVTFQNWRAANANPVDSLKSE